MRVRITFSKAGAMQYVGHLDLHRAWERTFRRSGLSLEYSQGFHPQPHINLACALPVGFTSDCELMDAWLAGDPSLTEIDSALRQALPPGIEVLRLEVIDPHAPALQTSVSSTIYLIIFLDDVPDMDARLQRIMSADHLPRTRRDRQYDLRPLIEEAELLPCNASRTLQIRLKMSAREAATGRPEELLAELGINFEDTLVHREKLVLINY